MRRTTLAIEDELLRQLKERAAAEQISLARLTNRLLAKALKEADDHIHYEVKWEVHDGGKPRVDLTDREALFDFMDGP
jgi:uncharacterized membrane protein YkoI